jgi:hypothetical protein
MQDLSFVRTKWAEVEAEETRLLRAMTIAEGVAAFTMLYAAYAPRLSEDAVYLCEHEAALIEQQRRLVRLAEWLRTHPEEAAAQW